MKGFNPGRVHTKQGVHQSSFGASLIFFIYIELYIHLFLFLKHLAKLIHNVDHLCDYTKLLKFNKSTRKLHKLISIIWNIFDVDMVQSIQEWTKYNLCKTALKFFKGCLPNILLDSFLNTLFHIYLPNLT